MKDAASCVLKIYKGLRWFEYYSQFGELSIVLGSISWKAIDDKGRYIKEIYRKSLQIAQLRTYLKDGETVHVYTSGVNAVSDIPPVG